MHIHCSINLLTQKLFSLSPRIPFKIDILFRACSPLIVVGCRVRKVWKRSTGVAEPKTSGRVVRFTVVFRAHRPRSRDSDGKLILRCPAANWKISLGPPLFIRKPGPADPVHFVHSLGRPFVRPSVRSLVVSAAVNSIRITNARN